MFRKFFYLEWKSFFRSSALTGNLVLKIFMIIGAIYFIGMFLLLGFGGYHILKENSPDDPLWIVNKYMIYYLLADLVVRLFLQKIPVINIKPLLTLPIKRSTIVHFALGKTILSFFNYVHFFFLLPFAITLAYNGYDSMGALFWFVGIAAIIYINNFLNILLNNKDNLFIGFMAILALLAGLQYFNIFDITDYTVSFFQGLFSTKYLFILPLLVLGALWYYSFLYFRSHLYLDTGLTGKQKEANTEDYTWLNRYGTLGTFLKNDIKLIRRNKRARTAVLMSAVFLLYGLLFFTGAFEAYDNSFMHMFAAIFVTGGFLFTFGQFVPSWDSAYYPLMMSQNIQYREYISSKWWLVVIGTIISTILASFYLFFGLDIYLMIIAAGIFNIGVNSHLVLLGGAYIKTPIDLTSSKQAFGDKKSFNVKTLLLSLPKMLLPMALYALGEGLIGKHMGVVLVIIAGVLGFAFRNKVFSVIERIYKTEKHETLSAYKQKN